MKQLVNCWNPLRAVAATTQPETVNVNAENCYGLGNQQPSPFEMGKVQRSGDIPHRFQVESKCELSRTDKEMIRSCGKPQVRREINKTCTVYGLLASGDDHYRYIGQSEVQLRRRLAGHLNQARNTNSQTHVHRWIRKVYKAGGKITIHAIERNCALDVTEIKWIEHYKSLYSDMVNIAQGGARGVLGLKRSEETKQKMRGPKAESTKQKMRKPKSEETRKKMSLAQLGNTKGKGEKNGNAKFTNQDVVDIKLRLERKESLSFIAKIYGVTKGTISKIKTGRSWKHIKTASRNTTADTVMEAICIPEEIRGALPSDFGRSRGIAWLNA